MADQTKIEWADSTFNPWIGCTRVSPACDHCYAAVSTPVRTKGIEWGAGKPRQRTSPANWKLPERWNAEPFYQCSACGWRGELKEPDPFGMCPDYNCRGDLTQVRRRVFCASLADVFDNEVPFSWRQDLFDLIGRTGNLDWLLLTKRIGNVKDMVAGAYMPSNVWLGITVVNQQEADRDVPKLLQVPARIRFLSIEPMLGPIEFSNVTKRSDAVQQLGRKALEGIHWVIGGGESGREPRPTHPDWVRSLRDQCAAAGVPFLFKQWGEWMRAELVPYELSNKVWTDKNGRFRSAQEMRDLGLTHEFKPSLPPGPPYFGCNHYLKVGKHAAGNMLDGRQHLEWPA